MERALSSTLCYTQKQPKIKCLSVHLVWYNVSMNFAQPNDYSTDAILRSLLQATLVPTAVDSRPKKRRKNARQIPPEPVVRKSDDLLGTDTMLAIANRVVAHRIPLLSKMALDEGFRLSDGSYEYVKKVYDSLSDTEKNCVTPGRKEYRDVREGLEARTVAHYGGEPAGFVDIYGPWPRKRLFGLNKGNGWYTIETAVKNEHRGNGLSSEMAVDAIKKVVGKIRENRRLHVENGGRLPIKYEPDVFMWNFLKGNKSSENAAVRAGFKKRTKTSYMLPMEQAEKMAFHKADKADDKTPTREELKRVYDILKADSELSNRIAGLGFGRNGDGLRRAYARMRDTSLVTLLRDGKRVRNMIVHTPGYIPSDDDAKRTLRQYVDANADVLRVIQSPSLSAKALHA